MFEMKPWSDSPVHEDFCINFFLDTNVLVYLVDNTYQSLSDFIELLGTTPFARVISSRYVIFEFVGVRKEEHYLRIAAANSEKTPEGQINFSSLFKYRRDYGNPHAIFEDEIENIRREVNAEIERIVRDFGIEFEYSSLHSDQLRPTLEVCLTSKISNHDSLVLVSSVLPQPKQTHDVILLTNDKAFVSSYDCANIDSLLSSYSIKPPKLVATKNVQPGNIQLTGNESDSKVVLEQKIKELLTNSIIEKLEKYYLGKTFAPDNPAFPSDCICFKLVEDYTVRKDVYVTVLGKDLDYIYTTKKPVNFRWNNSETEKGFTSPSDQKINISYRVVDVDDDGNEAEVSQEILDALKIEGNLVFIHPDSEM